MAKFRINSQGVGSYVYGLGVLPPDSEIDIPDRVQVANGPPPVIIDIWPHADWTPLDQDAVLRFQLCGRVPRKPGEFAAEFGIAPEATPAATPRSCGACRTVGHPATAKFCATCGAKLVEVKASELAPPAAAPAPGRAADQE